MTFKPMTRVELDKMSCMVPSCDHADHGGPMAIHGRCHIGAGTYAFYQDGLLTIECRACKKVVTVIAVAPT